MTVPGRIEVTIKINELPLPDLTENKWHRFIVDCDGKQVSVTIKPKVWNKFKSQAEQYPEWVAAIRGGITEINSNGFVLAQPSIQVFEKKPKEVKASS